MWPNPQETADLVTFTEEVSSYHYKLHFCNFQSFWDYFTSFPSDITFGDEKTDTNLLYEMVPASISIKQPIISPAIHSYGIQKLKYKFRQPIFRRNFVKKS